MLAKLGREVMLMKEEEKGRENSFVVWVAVVVLALVVVILVFTVVVM